MRASSAMASAAYIHAEALRAAAQLVHDDLDGL
jgi:hypothetical protein